MLHGIHAFDHDRANLYLDLILSELPPPARQRLEEFMTATTHLYQSDFARRYFSEGEAKGKAEGEANAVLAILDARGIEMPDKVRAEIAGCTDLDRLGAWIRQAATAQRIEDLGR